MDKAHNQTDNILRRIEKKLKENYTTAYRDVKKQMADVIAKMQLTGNAQQRYNLSQKYDRLSKLAEQLTDFINEADKEAVRIINGEMTNIYNVNANYIQGILEKSGATFKAIDRSKLKQLVDGSLSPFDKLAIEDLKNKDRILRQLRQELTTGIMLGESTNGIAKRIKKVTEKSLFDSVRIARTETTRVENGARADVGKAGEKLGFKMRKQWVSTHDSRTRDAHLDADGQIVDIDEPFIVDGEKLMYPGDTSLGASGSNTINCRCTMINIVVENDEK